MFIFQAEADLTNVLFLEVWIYEVGSSVFKMVMTAAYCTRDVLFVGAFLFTMWLPVMSFRGRAWFAGGRSCAPSTPVCHQVITNSIRSLGFHRL